MANSSSSELSSDLLMCKICHLPYNEPKRLPCLHTFCKACLVYHAKVNSVTTNDDAILCLFCPLCRQLCELPVRSGVESLPDHHLLRSLVETIESKSARYCDACAASSTCSTTSQQQQQQQQQQKLQRQKHDEEQKEKKSTWKKRRSRSSHCCVKCEEFLCDSCAREHRQQRATADHLVVSVGALKELCQVMTVEQLQKPNVAAKLVTKFALSVPGSSQTGIRASRRDRASGARAVASTLNPVGMAVTKADELVVTNAGDDSVLLYDMDGRFVRRIDQRQFQQQTTAQRDDDDDARKEETRHAAAAAAEASESTVGCVAITAEGYIAVAMRDDVTTASGSRVADRRVAVVESLAGREVKGCEIKPRSKGEVPPWPYGVATTEQGHVVVSDAANHCVYVFDADFRLVQRFGRRGGRNKQFKSPRHLAITPNNEILVSDYGNHCIKAFTLGGNFRFKLGSVGRDAGKFLHPTGICTDKFGNVFVADRDNHRVQMFDRTGKYIAAVLEDTCSASAGRDVRPLDVIVTSQTRLAVLLTGVEGVDFVEVHIYQLRCTLPPPEVRSVEQILSTIRALRRSDSTPSAAAIGFADQDDDDCGNDHRKVRFKLPESQRSRRPSSAATTGGDGGANSQVCVIL